MEPTTRCKFKVATVTTGEGPGARVKLTAVYPDKNLDGYEHGEDHAFFAATPFAELDMQINNPYGAELFQPGQKFYVDFTAAPEPTPAAA